MSLNNFIPVLWEAALLQNWQLVHRFVPLFNRDYEGDIRALGDAVKINSTGRVTVRDYTRDTDIADPESVIGAQQMLLIDKAKYFNFAIDDIDKAQINPQLMGPYTEQAAWELADVIDSYLSALLASETPAANTLTGATVGLASGDINAYNLLVNLSIALDEANVPSMNRWAVVPPWFKGLMQKDNRFVQYATPFAASNITQPTSTESHVWNAAGFDLIISNRVAQADSTHWSVQAGTSRAATFAVQLVETEAYRPQKRFGDALKGLCVYGAKVTRPNGLATVSCAKGTLA